MVENGAGDMAAVDQAAYGKRWARKGPLRRRRFTVRRTTQYWRHRAVASAS